ncbi:MAG: hypothetical protein ICV68_08880 [Pyrinomonadaceae bacterium]|nr:hypothetical protein [Pyrinomonadaceae bacterium]
MKKKITTSFVALLLLAIVFVPSSFAQRRRGTAAAPATQATASALNALPASDAVMLIDIKRLLNDVAPRLFAGDEAHLAKLNAEIDKLKTAYGLDVRSFDQLALGFRFLSPRAGVTTTNMVAVMRGSFNSGALLAAGRIAAEGKYQEEKYKNTSIYVFDLMTQGKAPMIMGMRVPKLAVAALDANTLVFGEPAGVRTTIDGSRLRGRLNAALIQMAMRTPNAFLSFGANIPASLTQGKDFGNPEINKNITAIRQAYGALGLTETGGLDLRAIARTERADQAKSLGETLAAFKQFGGMFVSQLPPDRSKLAQAALDSVTITTEGNETQLKLELAQAIINELMRSLQKKG